MITAREKAEHLISIAEAQIALEAAKQVLDARVAKARVRGVSWALIGSAIGVTRQSAWERFRHVEFYRG